jgi:hypothetical protein
MTFLKDADVSSFPKFDAQLDPNGTQMYSVYTKTKLPPYKGYHMPR